MRWLVVHKKSRYQELVLERHDAHVTELIEQGDVSVAQLERAHIAHNHSLKRVCEVLEERKFSYDVLSREHVAEIEGYDVVISVGGDGTVLDLSHKLAETPILAINSDPQTSVGYFCAGEAEEAGVLIDQVVDGTLAPFLLHRFAVRINDTEVTHPVLNDVLVCHANPAAVSSYILGIGEYTEAQRSSGVWISTPAGSTAAIRSAGGYVMPLHSQQYQFLVREPYRPKGRDYRLVKGINPLGEPLTLISKMSDGRIYLDGPHISYPFRIGDRLSVDGDAPPLRIYGVDPSRRIL